jgi:hypothetical protein
MCSDNTVPFLALTLALVINHYGRVHRHDPNFLVICQVEGCSSTYKTFEGHLRRHHKDVDFTCEQIERNIQNTRDEDDQMHVEFVDENDYHDDQ